MTHVPGKLEVSLRDGVITEDGEPLLLTGVSLCLGSRDDRMLAAKNTSHVVACWNALDGLNDEQVAAVRRLVAWFTIPRTCTYEELVEEHVKLKAIFPRREAK